MTNIDLDIWRGEWGLASIDLECLKVLVSVLHNLQLYCQPVRNRLLLICKQSTDIHEIYRSTSASS